MVRNKPYSQFSLITRNVDRLDWIIHREPVAGTTGPLFTLQLRTGCRALIFKFD